MGLFIAVFVGLPSIELVRFLLRLPPYNTAFITAYHTVG